MDSDVAAFYEDLWREKVREESEKGGRIPSFSQFMNDLLREFMVSLRGRGRS